MAEQEINVTKVSSKKDQPGTQTNETAAFNQLEAFIEQTLTSCDGLMNNMLERGSEENKTASQGTPVDQSGNASILKANKEGKTSFEQRVTNKKTPDGGVTQTMHLRSTETTFLRKRKDGTADLPERPASGGPGLPEDGKQDPKPQKPKKDEPGPSAPHQVVNIPVQRSPGPTGGKATSASVPKETRVEMQRTIQAASTETVSGRSAPVSQPSTSVSAATPKSAEKRKLGDPLATPKSPKSPRAPKSPKTPKDKKPKDSGRSTPKSPKPDKFKMPKSAMKQSTTSASVEGVPTPTKKVETKDKSKVQSSADKQRTSSSQSVLKPPLVRNGEMRCPECYAFWDGVNTGRLNPPIYETKNPSRSSPSDTALGMPDKPPAGAETVFGSATPTKRQDSSDKLGQDVKSAAGKVASDLVSRETVKDMVEQAVQKSPLKVKTHATVAGVHLNSDLIEKSDGLEASVVMVRDNAANADDSIHYELTLTPKQQKQMGDVFKTMQFKSNRKEGAVWIDGKQVWTKKYTPTVES